MDSFGADDFWTNGEFQNLYSTGDSYDQYNSYDNQMDTNWYQSVDNSEMFGTLFQNTAIDQFSVTPSYSNDLQLDEYQQNYQPYDLHHTSYTTYDQTQLFDSTNFEESSTQIFLTDMDEWKQKNLNEIMYQADANNNTSWESNIDDLLFDSSCDTVHFNGDLPARTFFCNDSCTSFLAETTENLLTYRPAQNHDVAKSQYSSVATSSKSTNSQAKTAQKQCAPNEDKEFVCSYGDCRKVYAKAGHLKAHIRRHIGDKPYVCHWPNCTWRFSRSDELSRHRRSHSGIKPYKCSYCPKCFSRSDHLTKHRKVHERKMAALKIKAVWNQLPPRKPGRKPKSAIAKDNNLNEL